MSTEGNERHACDFRNAPFSGCCYYEGSLSSSLSLFHALVFLSKIKRRPPALKPNHICRPPRKRTLFYNHKWFVKISMPHKKIRNLWQNTEFKYTRIFSVCCYYILLHLLSSKTMLFSPPAFVSLSLVHKITSWPNLKKIYIYNAL